MHNNSNMRNKQIEINTCKISPFLQNFAADSCLKNYPFFLISGSRAPHWKNTALFAKMGTNMVYALVGRGRADLQLVAAFAWHISVLGHQQAQWWPILRRIFMWERWVVSELNIGTERFMSWYQNVHWLTKIPHMHQVVENPWTKLHPGWNCRSFVENFWNKLE